MTRSMSKLVLGVAAAAVAVSGCRCGPTNVGGSKGEIRIVYDQDGVRVSGETGLYDFGQVPMGKTVAQKLIVQNIGRGILSVQAFEKVSGVPVTLGTVAEANPVFALNYDPTDIPSGETREFDLSFMPPLDPVQKSVLHEAQIQLRAGNTDPGKETAAITLRGTAVSGECDFDRTIDFGAVATGDTFVVSRTIHNGRPIDAQSFAGDITSSQGDGVFTYTAESSRGDFIIPSGKDKTIAIQFAPTESRDYFARVTVRPADGCPDVQVRLIGTGVNAVLSWTPATLDFGYVPPQTQVTADLTFANQAMRPVQLSGLNAFEGSTVSMVYKVTAADPGDLTKLTIPPSTRDASGTIVPGTAKLTMSFKPSVLGPKQATLKATCDLRNQPTVVVPLRGFGGGPAIDVRPSPVLDFGRVAYFAGANPPSFGTRRLTIQNVGTRPAAPDPRANLKLGALGAGKPYWSVVAKNSYTDVAELCVGAFDATSNTCLDDLPSTGPNSYNPANGLDAASMADVPVRVTPSGLVTGAPPGTVKEWEVTFFSNDARNPAVKITVRANPVLLPPCNYTVTPLNLNFGVVTPPSTKDLGFAVHNNGTNATDVCLLTNLDMRAGSDPMYSLPAGTVAEHELQPGETYQVLVRAWPQGPLPPSPTAALGEVLFNMSNPTNPQGDVHLTATIAPSCLTIAPSSLDFGTVQRNCNSPDRSFQIYNTCGTSVTINSFSMIAPAGEPAGGPNCAGTVPCPEFFTVSTGGISAGTLVCPPGQTSSGGTCIAGSSAPLSFSLKYRPINYGPDSGAFLLRVTQAGQQVDYVVTLRGNGDTMGLNTDTFRQDSKPKADILLVVDNSCSMYDKQVSLATNFQSFIKYATTSQVDFQIGVTTTDMDLGGQQGRLVAKTGGTIRIFRPTTPNLEQEFQALITDQNVLGTAGSGTECMMEPATLALTAPLITDPANNLGLLRQDAVLAVVAVTDAQDQSPQPPAYYLNQLLNIKGAQRPGLFTYNVVGPFLPSPPAGCSYDSTTDDGKHAFMVAQTNGVREEICTPDWAKALENIGKNAFGFRTNFYLTARPDLTAQPIDVQVDGLPLAATDGRGAVVWTYDPTNNSINFEPLYVPEPGKTLTVTYRVACIP